jgi:fucose permease
VALEFSTLFWAPAYLERVAGLSAPHAAASAAAFSVAMIVGRTISAFLVRRIASLRLLAGSLAMAIAGFAIYWGLPGPVTSITGLFIIGLGVAPLYPLTVGLAIQAAGPHGAAASARFMLAVGLSIISMPLLLGSLADGFGLWLAHLVLPGLVLAAAALLAIGVMAQRSATT